MPSAQDYFKSHTPHHHRFLVEPHRIILRLTGVDGGQYGEVTFIAKSRNKLEMQLGDDFVIYNREQVMELVRALEYFLSMSNDAASDDDSSIT